MGLLGYLSNNENFLSTICSSDKVKEGLPPVDYPDELTLTITRNQVCDEEITPEFLSKELSIILATKDQIVSKNKLTEKNRRFPKQPKIIRKLEMEPLDLYQSSA